MTRQEHETLVLSEIHNLFEYREGILYWKARPLEHFKNRNAYAIWNSRRAGKPIIGLCPYGYIRTSIVINARTFTYKVHKLVWAIHHGEFPTKPMDHINHDRTDNSIENLRVVTYQENARNRKLPVNNTSGTIGVIWNARAKSWAAAIKISGVRCHLGYFKNKNHAIAAREEANIKHGFHKNHGSL